MFIVDHPNMTKSFIPGTGTLIYIPKAEEKETVNSICEHIEDGRINVDDVQEKSVAKVLMRHFVDRQMHRQARGNGQRPQNINIPMTEKVAKLATNVSSVRRTQISYMTIGGVETKKEYERGINFLYKVIGQNAFDNFHKVLGTMHSYAICENDETVETALWFDMELNARNLRNGLLDHLGSPQSVLNELDQTRRTIQEQQRTIRQLEKELAQTQKVVETLESAFQHSRPSKRSRSSDKESDEDENNAKNITQDDKEKTSSSDEYDT